MFVRTSATYIIFFQFCLRCPFHRIDFLCKIQIIDFYIEILGTGQTLLKTNSIFITFLSIFLFKTFFVYHIDILFLSSRSFIAFCFVLHVYNFHLCLLVCVLTTTLHIITNNTLLLIPFTLSFASMFLQRVKGLKSTSKALYKS